jgi:chorismate mutase
MAKDNNHNQLLQLRKSIDEIDTQIINLLNQRMQVVMDVKNYKHSINETFFIKSAREADMIKNLLLKADKSIPRSTIVNIWRKIITSSNNLEQKLSITIHNPNQFADYGYLVREYYGDFVPLTFHNSVNNVVGEIESGAAQIGIFALPDNKHQNEHWWINLANNQSGIKIFAKIPFIGESLHQLVAVAKKEPEKSEDDCTLLSIELDKEFSKYQLEDILKKAGWKFKILQTAKIDQIANIDFYLVEMDGFFTEKSVEITNLSKSHIKPFVKVLGHFAKPIV